MEVSCRVYIAFQNSLEGFRVFSKENNILNSSLSFITFDLQLGLLLPIHEEEFIHANHKFNRCYDGITRSGVHLMHTNWLRFFCVSVSLYSRSRWSSNANEWMNVHANKMEYKIKINRCEYMCTCLCASV